MNKIKVTAKQYKIISLSYRISMFILVIIALSLYSLIFNKFLEFIIIFTTYFITKSLYPTQMHSKSLKTCSVISILIFIIATKVCHKITFSITSCILIGLFISYISYILSKYYNKAIEYDKIKDDYKSYINRRKYFDILNCSKDDMINKCRDLGFNSEQTDFCISAFVEKLNAYELADKYCIEYQSAKNKKTKYKNLLTK